MSYPIEVVDRPAQPVLSIRTRTPVGSLKMVLGNAYEAIMRYLIELRMEPAGPPFTAYFNMDMNDLDVEIGFPVPVSLPGKGDIQASEVPEGKAATCLYTGPYSDIGQGYEALTAWINEHGYQPTGVAYEFYLNDPNITPPPELMTQIVFPLSG
jgi:effector-binding domain-containing protein